MDTKARIQEMGSRARVAAQQLAGLPVRRKNAVLVAMADEIDASAASIKEANAIDVENGRQAGLSDALVDRLVLNDDRISAMSRGLRAVAALKDPVGTRISRWIRPNGLEIIKQRVPIGVIGIVYESRPNVTADTAALCLKTSNAVILRGGKEALSSNLAIAAALQRGGIRKGMPEFAVQMIDFTDRDAVRELVQMEGKVDLIIPRGGEALIRAVTEQARVPVIKHYKGVCHVYVDESANLSMGLSIVENAKCQRPGVCNAIEALLVHEAIAPSFLPELITRLQQRGVKIKGCEKTCNIVPGLEPAAEADWSSEWLDLVISIKVVDSVENAVNHINAYGSHHSDAIVAESVAAQKQFVRDVDSSTVYINASTRFTDGGEFGMGAEIGISTDKLHARGPMGLEELTTYKYVVSGKGQIRE